jgi:2-dehydropantoate 2-reductase
MLNILVMGAGAIGCFVGGSLATSGHRVTLLGRPPLMQKIAGHGLTLLWPDRPPQTASPETATAVDELSAAYDFILLTVKIPDIPPAIEQLAAQSLPAAETHIVSFQNGIGSEEQIAAVFGPEKTIAGTVTIPIRVPEAGVIEVSKVKGGLGLAPLYPPQPLNLLADALNQAGLTTATYADYRAMKWSKLLLNIVNNASCAILNQPPADIIVRPELFNLEIEALREAVVVMRAKGIKAVKLPGYPVDWLARLVSARWLSLALTRAILRPFMLSGRGTKMPSLQIDLAARRPTSEIEALNGAIVQAGQKLGVATPVNQTLTDILSGLVSGELTWASYQNQADKLLEAVAARRNG